VNSGATVWPYFSPQTLSASCVATWRLSPPHHDMRRSAAVACEASVSARAVVRCSFIGVLLPKGQPCARRETLRPLSRSKMCMLAASGRSRMVSSERSMRSNSAALATVVTSRPSSRACR